VRGSRCEACGTTQEPQALPHDSGDDVPTKQTQIRGYAPEPDVDLSGLERAVDAYRNKDTARFIELCIVAEGAGTARTAPAAEGQAWVLVLRGSLVFVTLRPAADELLLEAPIARLPTRQRLPALRLALELCAHEAAASRVALRGDMLLLRFAPRASMLSPALLRQYLREVGHLAARYAGLVTIGLDGLPAVTADQRATAGFELLGRTKKVHLGTGGSIRRSIPPLPHDGAPKPAPRASEPEARPRATGAPRMRREEEQAEAAAGDAIPAILSPMFSSTPPSSPGPAVPPPPPVPTMPVHTDGAAVAAPRARPATPHQPLPLMGAAPEGRRTGTPVQAPAQVSRAAEIELDTLSRRPEPASSVGASAATATPAIPPSDKLCMLLRHAQSLASLTLEERPASMTWLVRSTVFRAVYEFKDTVPDAVAHLYRCTGVGRDAPSGRTTSSQAANEPALLVMERVIVGRGIVPKEKPLALEPMVSAQQAKEHVARYMAEIGQAPNDAGIRHFLALGALTELLVRTKLPPQTDQRLRDIVAHAQREGAKPTAIELMMTALQRINS
jgi:hypothetical protein